MKMQENFLLRDQLDQQQHERNVERVTRLGDGQASTEEFKDRWSVTSDST